VSEYREYERTLTAVLNAYAQPQVRRYIAGLERSLGEEGFTGRLGIVRSDGGTMSARATTERPIDIAFSGPSGGVVGAAYLARRAGVPDVLTFDMGGTSTDVSLCRGGVTIKRDAQLGYHQFQSRSVDVHSVGAGGGSIAYLTPVGALRVGPRSAGADPGPACYGQGGTEPTVTDANVVLHRIPPGSRLAGTLELDEDAARRAVGTIAEGLGVDVIEAAAAIIAIAEENMHAALRVVSVERGYDPREFGLIAFGGAGPLHGSALGRLIHADPVIVPATPGVLSAFGFLAADVQHEFARTYLRLAEESPNGDLGVLLGELEREAHAWLELEGVEEGQREFDVFADCRYYMQDIQIPTRLAREEAAGDWGAVVRERFAAEHRRRYGFELEAPVEVATVRVVGRGVVARELAEALAAPTDGASVPQADRTESVVFDGAWVDTPVYDRAALHAGQRFDGPAIVVQQDSTAVVEPGFGAVVDAYGNLILRRA
jgi:N-methylhydantoinase A